MLGGLLSNLLSNLLGQGIEDVSDFARLKWGRLPFFIVAIGTTAFLLVGSIFLWQSPAHPGIVGLVNYPDAAPWMWLTPVLAGLTIVLLLIPVAGRLIFAFLSTVATTGVGFAALLSFQGQTSGITDAVTNLSLFGMLAGVLATLVLAMTDHPPLARFALPYATRLNHLRALQQFGRNHGYEIQGPDGAQNTLIVDGPFGSNHLMFITSAMRLSLSQNNATDGAVLTIVIRSQRDIPGFYSGPKRMEESKRQGLQELAIPISDKKTLYAYIQPYPQAPLTSAITEQIAQLIRARHDVMPDDAIIQATPLGMRVRYTRNIRRLRAKDGHPDAILAWLDQLVSTLEPISPALSPEELARRWQAYRPKM